MPQWLGPFTITAINPDYTCKLQHLYTAKFVRPHVHFSKLKLARLNRNLLRNKYLPLTLTSDDEPIIQQQTRQSPGATLSQMDVINSSITALDSSPPSSLSITPVVNTDDRAKPIIGSNQQQHDSLTKKCRSSRQRSPASAASTLSQLLSTSTTSVPSVITVADSVTTIPATPTRPTSPRRRKQIAEVSNPSLSTSFSQSCSTTGSPALAPQTRIPDHRMSEFSTNNLFRLPR